MVVDCQERVIDPRKSFVPLISFVVLGGFLSFATHTNTISMPRSLRILNLGSITAFPIIVGILAYVYFRTDVSLWEPPVLILWGLVGNFVILLLGFLITLDANVSSHATAGDPGVSRGLFYLEFFAITALTYSLLYGFAATRDRVVRALIVLVTPIVYGLVLFVQYM